MYFIEIAKSTFRTFLINNGTLKFLSDTFIDILFI